MQFRPGGKEIAPLVEGLPGVSFAEDGGLFVAFANWFVYVDDADDEDATLTWDVQSGGYVAAYVTPAGVTLNALADWDGVDSVRVIVSDPGDLADTVMCVVTVTPVNDLPRTFDLIEPAPGAVLPAGALIPFRWRQSVDVDDDPLEYELWVLSEADTQSFGAGSDTTLALDSLAVQPTYRWYVLARDSVGAGASDTLAFEVNRLVGVERPTSPKRFYLHSIPPVQAGGPARVRFDLPVACQVTLRVIDVSGRQVLSPLGHELLAAGSHAVDVSVGRLRSGVYFFLLSANSPVQGFAGSRKVLIYR